MRRRLVASALVLGTCVIAGSRPAPAQSTPYVANICTTQWGWCHLPARQIVNTACVCLTATDQPLAGTARSFPNNYPPSPYLRPHTR